MHMQTIMQLPVDRAYHQMGNRMGGGSSGCVLSTKPCQMPQSPNHFFEQKIFETSTFARMESYETVVPADMGQYDSFSETEVTSRPSSSARSRTPSPEPMIHPGIASGAYPMTPVFQPAPSPPSSDADFHRTRLNEKQQRGMQKLSLSLQDCLVASDWPVSVGSEGHPVSCADPCKFVGKARGCKDGVLCSHCHLCRWNRHRVRANANAEKQQRAQ
eukprot:TRINITY_DN94581_c0_g1_i1.p1 TRINITY_DN94581_c0_g1~~TRINITY_DN94581_c0_g1_i1.p1  ORF type:complete len:216 (-),score=30.37 TRINITY_DN94581_c0_g1_i1:166-813(-)